ncbi:hypothetical protein [Carp edema virus]|nr:hypothetical protein [Carp edema virus]
MSNFKEPLYIVIRDVFRNDYIYGELLYDRNYSLALSQTSIWDTNVFCVLLTYQHNPEELSEGVKSLFIHRNSTTNSPVTSSMLYNLISYSSSSVLVKVNEFDHNEEFDELIDTDNINTYYTRQDFLELVEFFEKSKVIKFGFNDIPGLPKFKLKEYGETKSFIGDRYDNITPETDEFKYVDHERSFEFFDEKVYDNLEGGDENLYDVFM